LGKDGNISLSMTEVSTDSENCKKELEMPARKLLSAISDVQDTLSMAVELDPEAKNGNADAFNFANMALMGFVDSNPTFTVASPRSIRDKDRKYILPGQHAGVFVQFGLADGTTLRMNIMGGLRTVSPNDMRDTDTSLQISHARRTEVISEQKTFLNGQISYPNGPIISSCIAFDRNSNGSFIQKSLGIDSENIEAHLDNMISFQMVNILIALQQ
jgi:hypothetical protein